MLKQKIGLIPRYNWDYGLIDWVKAFTAVFRPSPDGIKGLEQIFHSKPILTASGRTSLYAILKALGLPTGSRVGVPLFCCPVVFDAISQANLVPKFIDINPHDYNLSATDLKETRNSLSAIVVVHMFGQSADMDSILAVVGDIPVIEDCAQSLFSKYKEQYTGLLSTASFFSFRSGKYVSAGEGSAIFAKDSSLHRAIDKLVQTFDASSLFQETAHCTSTYIKSTLYNRPWYGTLGYPIGTKIDKKLNLTAKTGFKLEKITKSDLETINDRMDTFFRKVNKQRENALYLLKHLKMEDVILPYESKGCWTNYYQFAIRFKDAEQRDRMADYLFQHGIDSAKYLDEVVPVAKEHYNYQGDCPNAERCSKTVLSIPHYYTLSRRDLDHIVQCLNKGSRHLNN